MGNRGHRIPTSAVAAIARRRHARVDERVIAVIARAVPMDRERIGLYATFEELNIESLDVVNIVFALEDEFGIKLPPDFELAELSSVKNAATAIEAHLAGKGGDLV